MIGFAAETSDAIANGQAKLARKHLDAVLANQVGQGQGFGTEDNHLIWIDSDNPLDLGHASKGLLAERVVARIIDQFTNGASGITR